MRKSRVWPHFSPAPFLPRRRDPPPTAPSRESSAAGLARCLDGNAASLIPQRTDATSVRAVGGEGKRCVRLGGLRVDIKASDPHLAFPERSVRPVSRCTPRLEEHRVFRDEAHSAPGKRLNSKIEGVTPTCHDTPRSGGRPVVGCWGHLLQQRWYSQPPGNGGSRV